MTPTPKIPCRCGKGGAQCMIHNPPFPFLNVCPTCQFEGGEHQRECEKNKASPVPECEYDKLAKHADEVASKLGQYLPPENWEDKFNKEFVFRRENPIDICEVPDENGYRIEVNGEWGKIKSFIRSLRAEDERKVVEIIEQKCPIIERMTTIKGELWIKLPQLEDDDTELMILPKSVLDIIKSHYNHEDN